jgi:hypothetical protein
MLYEFMVISFGLNTTAATFQHMMKHILKALLDEGIVVYIDKILIYAKTEDKYDLLIKEVLK